MVYMSGSIFALIILFLVLVGTILAAAGYGYSRGLFMKQTRPAVFCVVCGTKIGWKRKACRMCGTAVLEPA